MPNLQPSTCNMQPDSDVLVRVSGVSKKFCLSLKKSLWYGLKDMGNELLGRRHGGHGGLRPKEFWAVHDVSFELKRGECLGLIGRNGAGKTTLLKMLNGLIKPDAGRIEMRGRVGALIALGAGFNPILTGRENIYTNASVLGMSKKEIDAKLDEIIDFAEIGDFIDTPVQNYSSGMAVRLGFAVAAGLVKPDILLLDEVLAVGDIGFVIKCLNAMQQLAARTAVIFVSHNMQYVSSFCNRAIMMEHGTGVIDTRELSEAIERYYALIKHERNEAGTGAAKIRHIAFRGTNQDGHVVALKQGETAELDLLFEVGKESAGASVEIYIMDEAMAPVMCLPIIGPDGQAVSFAAGTHALRLPLSKLELSAGKYSWTVCITDIASKLSLCRVQGLNEFQISAMRATWGRIVRPIFPLTENPAT